MHSWMRNPVYPRPGRGSLEIPAAATPADHAMVRHHNSSMKANWSGVPPALRV
jgi:hypothetical protein